MTKTVPQRVVMVERAGRLLEQWLASAHPVVPSPGWQGVWATRPDVPVATPHLHTDAPGPVVTGTASWYDGSRGFHDRAHIALPDGRWTGRVGGWARVCVVATGRCRRLPVVDWCQCYRGTRRARVADLSRLALVALRLSPRAGLYRVTVERLP